MKKEFIELINLGITSKANLPDLNDMTDRGHRPLKPFTAAKTVGTMQLIRDCNITNEKDFVDVFESKSKKSLEELTYEVFKHQNIYFGYEKHDLNTVFKYCYCCVVINSLRGSSTERKFDNWTKNNEIKTIMPPSNLDEQFHIDRLHTYNNEIITLISVKPSTFYNKYWQYVDVFLGLEFVYKQTKIDWKIYYESNNNFKELNRVNIINSLKKKIKDQSKNYQSLELNPLKDFLNEK